ncbi:MAG TPA: DEAD/DEAH box helicase [Bacilli bacterium]|nr:DEAD/DEAH box helicase [Bacilli bacterium]
MGNFIQNLKESLHKGFINRHEERSSRFRPKLLMNHVEKNETVLASILEELEKCEEFLFSVAFITESGLAMLKTHLLDLQRKGVKGRILTSTFLYFNQPKVFRELLKIKNVEVRLTKKVGFHSKGYIFKHENYYSLIVGSSNLTAQALKVNYEWNVKLTSHENGEIVHHFSRQFEDVWQDAEPLTMEWIDEYEATYVNEQANRDAVKVLEFPELYKTNAIKEALQIVPNKMQQIALEGIEAVRQAGEKRGLIISATGTGKTYLSAFDVRRYAPKRMLFIVHREQILQKAKADFQLILGGHDEQFGILSGTSKQVDAKYVFATIQTISNPDFLSTFERDAFNYILIDEVHKAGAPSYQRVIDYFEPEFLMGMTATPERTDDFNIFELFDYNIAYEIRLQEALEEDMLCPFHYFGVTDLVWNGETISETALLSQLVTNERIEHIIEKIEYYGFSGERVRGLMFCSRKEEAKELSLALNDRGYKTVALTGDDSQETRVHWVSELEAGRLDYILTVDIFNEGIDIPSVNQVVMLRQTESSIIFIQQLGRGLRKHDSKEYVTIIDFIGNYKNNYLIPVALSGDYSQNKDNIRRHTLEPSYIKGVSTVNFEEIAKKQIFKAIDQSNLTTMKILKEAYVQLKNRIGKMPYLLDFIQHHSLDPVVIAKRYANYFQFLIKMREEIPLLTEEENCVLTMLSMEVLDGKRKHEVILLELLLRHEEISLEKYIQCLEAENCRTDMETITSVARILDLSFYTKNDRKKYGDQPIVLFDSGETFKLAPSICERLRIQPFFKRLVEDVVQTAKEKAKRYQCKQPLSLYEKYSRKDVCKLLNWHNDESSTVYGYKAKHNTCPIFITYHKHDEVEASVNYGDEFLSQDVIKWYTRSNRKLTSEEVQTIIQAEEKQIDVHIFVKKDDGEGTDFYYLGKAKPEKESATQAEMTDKDGQALPVVHMNLLLEQGVEHQLYHYLKSETTGA